MSTENIGVLEEQIKSLAGAFETYVEKNDKAMDEIKVLLRGMSDALNKVLNTDADRAVRLGALEEWKRNLDQAMASSKEDRAQLWRKHDENAAEIKSVKQELQAEIALLKSRLSLVYAIGSLVGGALLLWFIGQLTGLIHP